METDHTQSVNNFDTNYLSIKQTNNVTIIEEHLPFTVKIAYNDEELEKAINIRQSAYARHVPELAELLKEPETYDFDLGSIVLLAESKLDGSALGSIRIQTNRYEKLKLESSVNLPPWLQNKTLAEAGRLGVVGNKMGRIVKTMLFKAYYLYCLQESIDWMVITARAPVDRDYDALLFKDVFPERGYIPMAHDANIASRVMALNVASVEPSWEHEHHPLFELFFRKNHLDIDLHFKEESKSKYVANKLIPSTRGGIML